MNQVFEEMALNYLQLRLNYSFSVLHFISSFFFQNSAYVQLSSDLMSCLNLHLDKKNHGEKMDLCTAAQSTARAEQGIETWNTRFHTGLMQQKDSQSFFMLLNNIYIYYIKC